MNMLTDFGMMAFLLLAGHALADYPLQGQYLSDAKNRHKPVPGTPWYQALAAHALITAESSRSSLGYGGWGLPRPSRTP